MKRCLEILRLASYCLVILSVVAGCTHEPPKAPATRVNQSSTQAAPADAVHAEPEAPQSESQEVKLIQGRPFDDWVAQAKNGEKWQDREQALSALQYNGLPLDREKTLRAFIDALADKSLLVQGQAAQGLSFAGRPTDPVAATTLVETLSKEITGERIASERGNAIGDSVDLSLVVRISDALAILGEPAHLPTLRKISEHRDVSPNARQALDKAIEQIELRASEEKDATKASGASKTNGAPQPESS